MMSANSLYTASAFLALLMPAPYHGVDSGRCPQPEDVVSVYYAPRGAEVLTYDRYSKCDVTFNFDGTDALLGAACDVVAHKESDRVPGVNGPVVTWSVNAIVPRTCLLTAIVANGPVVEYVIDCGDVF